MSQIDPWPFILQRDNDPKKLHIELGELGDVLGTVRPPCGSSVGVSNYKVDDIRWICVCVSECKEVRESCWENG